MKEGFEAITKLLREYTISKERISFLENRIKHLTPEAHSDYIESKMFASGYSGKTTKYMVVGKEEVAKLNKVEETAETYKSNCDREYRKAVSEIMEELLRLKYMALMVEDSLESIGRLHERYKILLERYYINNESMEEIAESLHLSRSRCYELCKEAVRYMAKLLYGTGFEKVYEYGVRCANI